MADYGNDEEDTIPGDAEVFDIDKMDEGKKSEKEEQPLYKIYRGSRIPVGRGVGISWKNRFDATRATRELIDEQWDEAYKYYNNTQQKGMQTPRGQFKRGDSTENVVYSNINIMLPAVYGQDPDITINSTDEADNDFINTLKTLLNALIRRKKHLNAKPKLRRAAGFALLTNSGILKIDYCLKDDSKEAAIMELSKLGEALAKAQNPTETEEIYGKIAALEDTMEVRENSGPKLGNVLPHNLWIDPYAELPDGSDASFMVEKVYLKTSMLNAKYTIKSPDGETVLAYKPTHKASFSSAQGSREDGLGMVMDAIASDQITNFEDEKRTGYRGLYYTECYYVWDKDTRRIFLFQKDDWTWPIWVWDDWMYLSRFFPYFIIAYGMSTGGSASVGEVSYYLDQQDEINEINRKVARIRRMIFEYFFYDSDATDTNEIAKLVKALRGEATGDEQIVGIKVPENKKIGDMIMNLPGPSKDAEPFFKKEPIMDTINRVSNTSDALRGVQFKTNTNEAAIQTYQDSTRMAIGSKQDVVEDIVGDLCQALAELCVQFMGPEEVAGIVGMYSALSWQNMTVDVFNSQYGMEVVAGSTEKPNSQFKKKEAIQIGQMLGQFSSAAPLTALKIMLKVLENAFTEVVIKPEDWANLEREAEASMRQGDSTGGAGLPEQVGQQAANGQQTASQQQPQNLVQAAMNLPPQVKQQIMQLKTQGASPQQIKEALVKAVQQNGSGAPQGQPTQPQPQPAQQQAQF